MSRWGVWAAHRYVQAGAAVPRQHGPDGQPLRRSWRTVRPSVAASVRQIRALRPQPWWPRAFGLLCLGIACMAALDPVGALPADLQASASARTRAELSIVSAIAPIGEVTMPTAFRWRAGDCQGPFTLLLLDAGYDEVARVEGGDATEWPAAHFRAWLRRGQTYSWCVLASAFGRPVVSPLQSFTIL